MLQLKASCLQKLKSPLPRDAQGLRGNGRRRVQLDDLRAARNNTIQPRSVRRGRGVRRTEPRDDEHKITTRPSPSGRSRRHGSCRATAYTTRRSPWRTRQSDHRHRPIPSLWPGESYEGPGVVLAGGRPRQQPFHHVPSCRFYHYQQKEKRHRHSQRPCSARAGREHLLHSHYSSQAALPQLHFVSSSLLPPARISIHVRARPPPLPFFYGAVDHPHTVMRRISFMSQQTHPPRKCPSVPPRSRPARTPTLAELGRVACPIVEGLRGARDPQAIPNPIARPSRCARRWRRPRSLADRLREDPRVRVPIVERLTPGGGSPNALILTPTRELASQVTEEFRMQMAKDVKRLRIRLRVRRRRARPAGEASPPCRHRDRHPGPVDRPGGSAECSASTTCTSAYWTRPTRCSTSASCPTSRAVLPSAAARAARPFSSPQHSTARSDGSRHASVQNPVGRRGRHQGLTTPSPQASPPSSAVEQPLQHFHKHSSLS